MAKRIPNLFPVSVLAFSIAVVIAWASGGSNLAAQPPSPNSEATLPQTKPGGTAWSNYERREILRFSPMPPPPPDPSNGHADDPKAADLGRALFFDVRFSANQKVSCATCHQPDKYFTDGRTVGVGIASTTRNTPSILGAAQSHWQFWDGRVDSLWAQALLPMEDTREHGTSRLQAAHLIFDHYRADYEAIFGKLPVLSDENRFPTRGMPRPASGQPVEPTLLKAWDSMSPEDRRDVNVVFSNVGKAIEAYERKLVPGEAPIDRFVAKVRGGDDSGGGELPESAVRGLKLFLNEGQCINCHFGPRFTNEGFHAVFIDDPPNTPHSMHDAGRELGAKLLLASEFNRAGEFSDQHDDQELLHIRTTPGLPTFKIPSLRNVARTGPYGHNGTLATLDDVVEHYNTLGRNPRTQPIDRLLKSLHFTPQQKADLVAFLTSLTAPPPAAGALRK